MDNFQNTTPETSPLAEQVSHFYKNDFKNLMLTFFRNPLNGLLDLLRNPPEKAFLHSMILFASVFVLYFAGSWLMAGDARDYMGFSTFLSIGLTPVWVMLAISGLSFGIKLASGSANFKSELLTGALCGIPMGLVIPLGLLARIFGDDVNAFTLLQNPLATGGLMMLLPVYLFLMMVNVFQQSLKSAGIREVLAWYLSPVSVLLAFYLGLKVAQNLF